MAPENSSCNIPSRFLEDFPLFRRLKHGCLTGLGVGTGYVDLEAIRMECSICQDQRSFKPYTNDYDRDDGPVRFISSGPASENHWRVLSLTYVCTHCDVGQRLFIVHIDTREGTVHKIGQLPPWQISLPREMTDLLGDTTSSLYRNGRICEAQGYGIAAYAYYRRVVEASIDLLLNALVELADPEEQEHIQQVLDEEGRRVSGSEKIDRVKHLLPASLRPGGINPLDVLFGFLSEHLHTMTDDECLEQAAHVREVLGYLIANLESARRNRTGYEMALRKLMGAERDNRLD